MTQFAHRVLVTGGAGFIGSHSVELLLARGYRVRVLDNLSSGNLSNLPLQNRRLEFVKGDIRDASSVAQAMRDVSLCLHLAAQVSVVRSVEDPAASASHNILGTLNVFHAAASAGVERIVYASSAAVYGIPRYLPIRETLTPSPISPYGLEKWADERYAELLHTSQGLSSLGLRYFNVYGPRQDPQSPYAGVIARFLDTLLLGQSPRIFGDGLQTRDFIYVRDVARANVSALETGHQGVCNVATGRRTNLLGLLETLGSLTHHPPALQFSPARQDDIRDSCGHTQRLEQWLDIQAEWSLEDGLHALVSSTIQQQPADAITTTSHG